jgi:diguanylate cyclase (GGDEF)-like protein
MFSYTLFALPHTISAVILLALGVYSLRYRTLPMATPFGLLVLAAALWSTLYTLELCTNDFGLKIFWAKARFIGLAPLSTLWLIVGIQHSGRLRWFRGARWLLLAIIPTGTILLSLTSGYHRVFRYDYSILQHEGFSVVLFKNGPLFWMYALYSYAMAVLTGVVLYGSFKGRDTIHRRQTVLVISAIMFFIIVDILFQAGITPIRQYTLSPAALAVSALLLALAVFQYRILDLAPITRSMVMDAISDIILIADDTGRLIEYNRAAASLFGIDPRRSTHVPMRDLHPFFAGICTGSQGCGNFDGLAQLDIKGEKRDFMATVEPVFFGGKHRVGTLAHLKDVTEEKRLEREIRQSNSELVEKIEKIELLQRELRDQALQDPLTGLFNRRYLDEMIDRAVSLADRNGAQIAFVMLDIDHFKSVNDTWGHQAGDALLKDLAAILKGKTRKSDIACRYGGEEFLVVFNGVPAAQALDMVETIRTLFEANVTRYGGQELRATFSAGIAAIPEHGADPWSVIRRADEALYRAKLEGRNRVVLCAGA